MAYAWMPEARRIRGDADGGPLRGGAPRAVWLALGTAPGTVSIQSAAARLISDRRPCHLIWDPVTGEIGQLISVLRAGRALGAADGVGWAPERVSARADKVNADGRINVQIGVLSQLTEPFTAGPMIGIDAIMSWLDSWDVPRHWPSGQPEGYVAPMFGGPGYSTATLGLGAVGHGSTVLGAPGRTLAAQLLLRERSRVRWARGGHFGASQVPGCANTGPGAIDIDRLTGPHGLQVRTRDLPVARTESPALAIPA